MSFVTIMFCSCLLRFSGPSLCLRTKDSWTSIPEESPSKSSSLLFALIAALSVVLDSSEVRDKSSGMQLTWFGGGEVFTSLSQDSPCLKLASVLTGFRIVSLRACVNPESEVTGDESQLLVYCTESNENCKLLTADVGVVVDSCNGSNGANFCKFVICFNISLMFRSIVLISWPILVTFFSSLLTQHLVPSTSSCKPWTCGVNLSVRSETNTSILYPSSA